jgi:hypothetical protein
MLILHSTQTAQADLTLPCLHRLRRLRACAPARLRACAPARLRAFAPSRRRLRCVFVAPISLRQKIILWILAFCADILCIY